MQSQERTRPGLSRHDDPLSRYCTRLMLVVHSFSSGFEEENTSGVSQRPSHLLFCAYG